MKITQAFILVAGLMLLGATAHSNAAEWTEAQGELEFVSAQNQDWNDRLFWRNTVLHSNDFFIEKAWDDKKDSFVSEVSFEGERLSSTRHLISSSRLVYGLAVGSRHKPEYLTYAKKQAQFILDKMVERDSLGPFFKSSVDANGVSVGEQRILVVNEQAYGLNGLVALYSVTKDPDLLHDIENLYRSFYMRFYDVQNKGFFDGFDLMDQSQIQTKSYNSTVYVATSFLLELSKLNTTSKVSYIQTIEELATIVSEKFLDPDTGWITENFTADWTPEWRGWQKQTVETPEGAKEFTIGVVGHNFQAAWFLMRAASLQEISSASKQKFLHAARETLSSMMRSNAVDLDFGGVYDVFRREDGQHMWHTNKAWWQQAQAILALTKALEIDLFIDSEEFDSAYLAELRDITLNFYVNNFIDLENGGEFAVVSREGQAVESEKKGHRGKSSYHATELAYYMEIYLQRSF